MLEMIPVTRAHGLQEVEINKMQRYLKGIMHQGFQLDLMNNLFGAASWVVFQSFQILCLAFTGCLAVKGKIGVGEVVLFQTYFTQIVGQISTLINIYPDLCKEWSPSVPSAIFSKKSRWSPTIPSSLWATSRETSVSATWISNIPMGNDIF